MASGKGNKQRRADQNRRQRDALQSRKANASIPAPTPKASSAKSSSAAAPGGGRSGSLLGRLRGGAGTAASGATSKPAPKPAISSRTGGGSRSSAGAPTTRREAAAAARAAQPVGYRAALTALLAAGAAIVLICLQTTPVNADGDIYTSQKHVAEWADSALHAAQKAPAADAPAVVKAVGDWAPGRSTERLIQALWPTSALVILPVIAAYLGFRAVQRRRSSRIVNRAMYATLFGAFLTFNLFIFFLPTVIAISVAGFQVRRAENLQIAAAQQDEAGDREDVIDAEVVEDAPGDDEDG